MARPAKSSGQALEASSSALNFGVRSEKKHHVEKKSATAAAGGRQGLRSSTTHGRVSTMSSSIVRATALLTALLANACSGGTDAGKPGSTSPASDETAADRDEGATAAPASPAEQAAFGVAQGTWKVCEYQNGGRTFYQAREVEVSVVGDVLTWKENDRTWTGVIDSVAMRWTGKREASYDVELRFTADGVRALGHWYYPVVAGHLSADFLCPDHV
jgi:hypothetical protein